MEFKVNTLLQKLDPEPVHLRRTLASIGINKSKKGNASTTTPFPERHRHIHRESSACAHGLDVVFAFTFFQLAF
jgi:hypothetical protein